MTKEDWKRDWEETKDILYNFVACRKYDNDMHAAVEEFKKEMLQWLENGSADEQNPMTTATQEQWYSLYLEKKRLERRRLSMRYKSYKHIPYQSDTMPQTVCTYHNDGKYLVCNVSQMTWMEKSYERDGVLIGQEGQSRDVTYYVMRSHNAAGLHICPNCGAELPLEKLLDGCDYCNTKFDISAYQDKVTSITKNKNNYESRETNGAVVGWLMLTVLGILMTFWLLMLGAINGGAGLLLPLIGVLMAVGGFMGIMFSNRKAIHNTKMKRRLQDNNPDFSKEDFIASLDCKLKTIHFAETPEELAAFVKCDIAPCLQNYQNIVSCETGKFVMKNYRVEGEWQYIDVHREMRVLRDCGSYLQAAGGVIAMTLAKKLSYKLKNDVSMYHCKGCGASVSLVEGGKCQYCGNEMDYGAYDWIVTDYKHINEL